MINKLIYIVIIYIFSFSSLISQSDINLGGFIRLDSYYDTRQVQGIRDNVLMLYPKNIKLNKNNEDINAKSSMHYSSILTRINAKFTNKKFLDARASGFLEAEFIGQNDLNTNVLKLRHAYFDLDWNTSKLTIGQTWHPMFVSDIMPRALAFIMLPIIQNPQIKYQHRFNDDFYITAAALMQRDFTSIGPKGFSTSYQRLTGMPALDLELKYKSKDGSFIAGAGAEYKTIRPYSEFDGKTVETNLNSITANAFFGVRTPKTNLKFTAWYGGNMADFLMPGGYAISAYNNQGLPSQYTAFHNLASMIDVSFNINKNLAIGSLIAANKNLGTKDDISVDNPYWARGRDIDLLYHIAPRISYRINKVQFGLECAYSAAHYGVQKELINKKLWNGKWKTTNDVHNWRLLFVTMFFI